ncbi:hypothetical protein [Solilutibacter silvestris]|uniref:Uncharacterized protein n=1 Tax=Solilutibacter silvestris TaxID=1645665 RepID=A0A2K1Q1B1_9GAMM|nr:hypothetical protein [Lysobacter silvestris]PNS08820.1 hypothetical protein Lysil_0449 [Lysobacter silvestris]
MNVYTMPKTVRTANPQAAHANPSTYERQEAAPFGTGYGRSSGYVQRPRYTRDWAPARFTMR